MWHRGPKPVACRFWLFILIIILHCIWFKILFTEKYVVSNCYTRWIRTIKKVKKSIKKCMIFHVIIILRDHYFIIMKLFRTIKFFILNQIGLKQTALKSGYNFTNSRTPAEFKKCKLENPSLVFWPLAQYLGNGKRRVLSPWDTYM